MAGFAETLRRGGVVGAGGAGFPTYMKLSAKAEFMIVNGAECEPLLHKDQALLARHPDLVLEGLRYAMSATGAEKSLLAVKAKHAELVQSLNRILAGAEYVELCTLPDAYPSGDEVVLIYEALGRVVPPGALPGKVGVLVDNVETLYNIARALHGAPVTDKFVTVTGRVRNPVTLKLPIGAPFTEALALAGGPLDREFRLLVDGPMMGTLAEDLAQPVTKTTSALIVLPVAHHLVMMKMRPLAQIVRTARSACTSCTFCTETCPRRLLGHPIQPHLIMRAIGYNALPEREKKYGEPLHQVYQNARYCVGCGTCNIVCPMGLQPRAVCAYIKGNLPPDKKSASVDRTEPLSAREGRRMPTSRLYQRLGLEDFKDFHPAVEEDAAQTVTRVHLPLRQGIGAPSMPVVQPGQRVEKGEPVAEPPPDKLGVSLHASIAGKVVRVTAEEVVIEKP